VPAGGRPGFEAVAQVPVLLVPDPWPDADLEGGNLRPIDRVGRLACAAAGRALADAGLIDSDRSGLVLGTLFGGLRTISEFDRRALSQGPLYASPLDFANTVINAAAGQTAIWHHLEGPNATIAGGSCAALQALDWVWDLLREGEARVVLAGGAEELSPAALEGFAATGALSRSAGRPFAADRDGFTLAEGAALLALELESSAQARGARVRGRVLAVAGGFDPSRGADPVRASAAAVRALETALADAGVAPAAVVLVSAGANGAVVGDGVEAAAIEAVFGPAVEVIAIKGQLGESLGAAGALQVIAALEVLADRAPGELAVVLARAFDGACWAIVLEGVVNES
jgi:3-oxoacyl-[acyl-carrier-protein] synthase II